MGFKLLSVSRQFFKNLKNKDSFLPSSTSISGHRNMYSTQANPQNALKEVEEVKINVPWGHIAGKWWGLKDVRPIICLHGWQDNAGTFDTLIPLLPPHQSYLALDLPGHGMSSWIPDGMYYHSTDFLYMLLLVMKQYNWDKISLLGHSLGSICSFNFAAAFPDKVDLVIGLDALKPHVRPIEKIPISIASRIESYIIADERNRDKSEPPSYFYDEMVEKLHIGTFQSIDRESCKYILARNIKKSTKYPDKYYFSRDSRLKSYNYGYVSQELNIVMAQRIISPYLFFKATDASYYEEKKYFDQALDVMRRNPLFEFYEVEGSHHVHLNEPTKVSSIISDFINKYRPAKPLSKL